MGKKKIPCKHGRATNMQLAEGVTLTFNAQKYNKPNLPCNGLGWNHTLAIGGTGTGKSRSYIRPKYLQFTDRSVDWKSHLHGY